MQKIFEILGCIESEILIFCWANNELDGSFISMGNFDWKKMDGEIKEEKL